MMFPPSPGSLGAAGMAAGKGHYIVLNVVVSTEADSSDIDLNESA
jgi:hypothetical protein